MALTNEKSLQLFNEQMFKQVEGDLFEFKRNSQKSRVFAFRDGKCWYVVDVFLDKKEDELPPGVVKRAKELMDEAKAVLAKLKRSARR